MSVSDDAKLCRTCGEVRPSAEFRKGRAKCKPCQAETSRKWYEENRDRRIEAARKWREENRDRAAETRRKYYEENRDRRIEAARKWYEENRDRAAENVRKWAAENRDRRAENMRKWREENPDKTAEAARRRRARKRGMPDDGTTLADLLERDGPACYLCGHDTAGCTDRRYRATVEHVIPLDPGTHTADNLRVACGSCNSRKGRRLLADLDLPWFCDCPTCQ